jgi:hypothetical protein
MAAFASTSIRHRLFQRLRTNLPAKLAGAGIAAALRSQYKDPFRHLCGPLLLPHFLGRSCGLPCHLHWPRDQFDSAAKKIFDLPRH